MEDVVRHHVVPFLDARSFLVACLVNRRAWSGRRTTDVAYDAANRYEHVLHGKIPPGVSMPRGATRVATGERLWLIRDCEFLHSVTTSGLITEYSRRDGRVLRRMLARPSVERVESLHGVFVLVCSEGVCAYCRRSLYCMDLHRLAAVKSSEVLAVNILDEDVFRVVLPMRIVTFSFSSYMHRFVWHSHPSVAEINRPMVCSATGAFFTTTCAGRVLQSFALMSDNDIIDLGNVRLTLRHADCMTTTRDRTHLFVVRLGQSHVDVAVYRMRDLFLVDEITIDAMGRVFVDDHFLTIVAYAGRSARYDYRSSRVAYFEGVPEHAAALVDDDTCAVLQEDAGLLLH